MNKILVYLEMEAGKNTLKRVSGEMITAARNLAKENSAEFHGVVIGDDDNAIKTAGDYGLSKAYKINNEFLSQYSSTAVAKAIHQLIDSGNYDTVIFPANAAGKELAPRVAAKIEAGYISDVIAFSKDGENVIAKKPVYAGKSIISTKIDTEKQVFSLRPNVFTATNENTDVTIEEFSATLTADDTKVKVVSLEKNEGKLDVLEADVVVSGGRGIKGPENYPLIENLAKAFGGAVGASRAVVDSGWRPHSEQVGQTGKTVAPTLYVACAISGAVQHLAGMSTSKTIVAINKDKDAPIFKVADYGLVGDIFEILPKLTEKVTEVTGN
jgi:electron transfer flavoprotein alpha subunit